MRRCRRPIAVIAIGLTILQAVLAGLATAHAAAALTETSFGVICHGNGAAAPADDPPGDAGKVLPICCVVCVTSAPPAALSHAALPIRFSPGCGRVAAAATGAAVSIAARAVRAGFSQAPPSLDESH
jgi:hypothetical protein